MSANLYELIEAAMPGPEKICIETPQGREVSYGAIAALSGRFANALVELGVKPGDRVAVQVEKSVEAVMLCLACLRVGAVYLPLNTAYTEAEVAYFLQDAQPHLLVCRPKSEAGLRAVANNAGTAQVISLEDDGAGALTDLAMTLPDAFATAARTENDLAAILYTSGTTGRSKGAMLTHGNLSSNAQVLVKTWWFTSDDVLLHALPIYHTHGLFVATNVTLLAGARMLFLPKFDADTVMALLPRATTMMGVPTFYTRLLSRPDFTRDHVAHMRLFISGSAPLLAETHTEFQARTGHAILERYGMTETGMNTSNPYQGERIAGTVGFPLEGTEIRIADPETGAVLASDEIGVIEVRGPNVFSGYWRMPEKTESEFRKDGFFITGDVGKIDARGYVHIVGRAKDLIISGGFNVYPKEIETLIDALPGVSESAVIGLPHPDFGEGVAAVIVTKQDAVLEEQDVVDGLQGQLAKFKQPKRIFLVPELPRNTMGKVQKNILRERYKDAFAG